MKEEDAMKIDTKSIITVTEANQNFSKATKLAERQGKVYVFKNNKPRYLLIDLEKEPEIEMTDEEKTLFVAERILKKHKKAFLELAK